MRAHKEQYTTTENIDHNNKQHNTYDTQQALDWLGQVIPQGSLRFKCSPSKCTSNFPLFIQIHCGACNFQLFVQLVCNTFCTVLCSAFNFPLSMELNVL